ncbi:zinc finger MYND domain-containing protein [Phanerochaete sordida]|uniref:Zinc finger MYND domain-containing protein n=1 Tax=Phanerochaete sordida TaxID=48140 RepID=A0A9P3LMB5_9APHY|nr:zinc finger MYND domain-containing protein [Phanerochaete sordida]
MAPPPNSFLTCDKINLLLSASRRDLAAVGPKIHRACQHCLKRAGADGTLFRCTGCHGGTRYCSKECQRADWPNHKPACQAEQAIAPRYAAERAETLNAFAKRNSSFFTKLADEMLDTVQNPQNAKDYALIIRVELKKEAEGSDPRWVVVRAEVTEKKTLQPRLLEIMEGGTMPPGDSSSHTSRPPVCVAIRSMMPPVKDTSSWAILRGLEYAPPKK